MVRTTLAGGLLAVVALLAASEARGCDACAAMLRGLQKHEGTLTREVLVLEDWDRVIPRQDALPELSLPVRRIVIWSLKTARGNYTLNFGNEGVKRLAEGLMGRDVVVTGPLTGGVIEVRDMESKPSEFSGVVKRVPVRCLPPSWKLATRTGEYHLILSDKLSKQARELTGKSVVVKGRLTTSGLVVTAIESVVIHRCPETVKPLVVSAF